MPPSDPVGSAGSRSGGRQPWQRQRAALGIDATQRAPAPGGSRAPNPIAPLRSSEYGSCGGAGGRGRPGIMRPPPSRRSRPLIVCSVEYSSPCGAIGTSVQSTCSSSSSDDREPRDARDAGDAEDALIDARVEDRAAERPAPPVVAAAQRMEVVDERMRRSSSCTCAASAVSSATTSPRTSTC